MNRLDLNCSLYHSTGDISFLCDILKSGYLQSYMIQMYGYNSLEYQRYVRMLWCDNFVYLSLSPSTFLSSLIIDSNVVNELNAVPGKYNKEILVYDDIKLKKYLVGVYFNAKNNLLTMDDVNNYNKIKEILNKYNYDVPLISSSEISINNNIKKKLLA